jgi:hypothetical protein
MSQPERILGHIVNLDIVKRRVTIEVDFFDPDKQEILESFLKSKEHFSFSFWKPFRQSKSIQQLRKYYLCLHKLLNKLGIYPDSDKVKAIDSEIKKRVFNCETLELLGQTVPLLPSKADMSWEDMYKMIQYIYDNYGVLVEDEMEIR